MNAHEFAAHLLVAIEGYDDAIGFDDEGCLRSIRTYSDAGILTRDAGLVVHFADGTEFQLTIVRSRRADNGDES